MGWNDARFLWLLISVPIAAILMSLSTRRFRQRLERLFGATKGQPGHRGWPYWVKAIVLMLAVSLLAVSAAGPRWGWRWTESRQKGLDIMVAVDVSRSMDARDMDPSRMERAKRLVYDLLDVAEGDRIGLVAFAGVAFVQCPLTSDHAATRMFMEVMATNLIPVQGTDFSQALETALKSLTSGGEGQGKLLLVISDGEDHGPAIETQVEAAKKAGVKVFAVGMGTTEGGPISAEDGQLKTDGSGQVVITRLQEETLKRMALETGGSYMRAADSGAAVEKLYHAGMRQAGTDQETRSSRERVWFERYQWFAGAALLLLILESVLCVPNRVVMILLVSAACLATNARADNAETLFSNGVAEEAKGDVKKAATLFEQASEGAKSRALKQRSLYNLGVVKAKLNDLEGAKKAFDEALALDPQDQQTRDNLRVVQKKDEEQKKQQQGSKNQDEKNQDQKNQDQKNQDQKNQDQKNQDQKNQDQKNQDQKNQDQNKSDEKRDDSKDDASKDQAKKDGDKNEDKTKPNGKQDESKKPEGDDGAKPKDEKPEESKSGKLDDKPLDAKEMSKEQAERLLRMVPDDMGKFYRPPSEPMKTKKRDQDW